MRIPGWGDVAERTRPGYVIAAHRAAEVEDMKLRILWLSYYWPDVLGRRMDIRRTGPRPRPLPIPRRFGGLP